MLPPSLSQILTRLDTGTLTTFARALLQAEASRMRLPSDAVQLSENFYVGDGGLDARVVGMPEGGLLPMGLSGWQLKAHKTTEPSRLDFPTELNKPLVRELFDADGTYVLVWPQQFNPRQKDEVMVKLRASVPEVYENPKLVHYDAQALLALCERHPQVVEGFGLAEFGAMRSLKELDAELRIEQRPYQPDEPRAESIEQLRSLAVSEDQEALIACVLGLAGTGKTRMVREALNDDRLRDQVLYTDSPTDLDSFIGYLLREPRSQGIIVADELEPEAALRLQRRLGGAQGRWRLVTVSSIIDVRPHPPGARDIVLTPLDPDATRDLVMRSAGLDETAARMVAEVAAGFPALAFALAQAKFENPELNLSELAHLHQTSQLLERALPDSNLRRALAPLALFRGLGVSGELSYELDAVAEVFGLDASELRGVIERERRLFRFVSAAGDYRSVSPTLVAVWLATELLEATHDLDRRIPGLPQAVQDSFYDQINLFGDSSEPLNESLRRLLADFERFRQPKDFDQAAARLVRAAVAAVPSTVAEQLTTLLSRSSTADLARLPRRPLVNTLVELLWNSDTWQRAIEGLLLLARHENEKWSNNATGHFKHFFSLALAGTTVSHAIRSAWLREQILSWEGDDDVVILFAEAAAQGLNPYSSRIRSGGLYHEEPKDWQPSSREEALAAYRAATESLLLCLDRASPSSRPMIAKELGSVLISLKTAGLIAWFTEQLRTRELDDGVRGEILGDAIRVSRIETLQADKQQRSIDETHMAEIASLIQLCEGDGLEAQLRAVLRTPAWELAATQDELLGTPARLNELATEIASAAEHMEELAAIGRELKDQQTRYRLWRLVAGIVGAPRVGALVISHDAAIDEAILAAALSVADETGAGPWATEVISRLLDGPEPDQAMRLALSADVTNDRMILVLDRAEQRGISVRPLGQLSLGARARSLPEELTIRLLRGLLDEGEHNAALTSVAQIAEDRQLSDRMSQLAFEIAMTAVAAGGGTMDDYLVGMLATEHVFSTAQLVELWDARLRHRQGLVEEVDEILTVGVLEANPTHALEVVTTLIRDEASGSANFSLFASRDLYLLARLADALGAERVLRTVEKFDEYPKLIALHHMQWAGDIPHPLTRSVLVSPMLTGLETEAATCFFNVLGVVAGPYWRGLERERERAASWSDHLQGTSAERWTRALVERYDNEIESHRKQEAEEDFRRGS